jgi:hypothetical protein
MLLLRVQMLQYDIHSVPCFVLLEPGGVIRHAVAVQLSKDTMTASMQACTAAAASEYM